MARETLRAIESLASQWKDAIYVKQGDIKPTSCILGIKLILHLCDLGLKERYRTLQNTQMKEYICSIGSFKLPVAVILYILVIATFLIWAISACQKHTDFG